MSLKKPQIKKIERLLSEKGYGERRREIAISYIKGFFDTVNKHPKDVVKQDVEAYLARTNNTHLKFWITFFYSNMLNQFQKNKFSRLEKNLKAVYKNDRQVEEMMRYIRKLYSNSHKPLYKITKQDIKDFIEAEKYSGEELLKVYSIFEMLANNNSDDRHKILILNKDKKFIDGRAINIVGDVKSIMLLANEHGKSYCIKMNTLVTHCTVKPCEFYASGCTSTSPPIALANQMEVSSQKEIILN